VQVAGEGQAEVGAAVVARVREQLLCRQLTPSILLGAELACTQQTQDEDAIVHGNFSMTTS
jgi:hypothetical protein